MGKKISEKEIIEKFCELKNIEPNKKWSSFICKTIVNQVVVSTDSADFTLVNKILGRAKFLFQHFIFRPTIATALIVILVISSITVVWADNKALPGDSLYPIKLAIEEMQGNLIISPSKKAIYQAQLIQKRVSEIKKIVNSKTPKQEKKQMVKVGIVQLKKQLVTINNQLINTSAASSVAQKIDDAKQELIKVKEEASKEIGVGDVAQKIDQTVKAVDEVATKALVVSVDHNHQVNSQKVSDKIQETENELKLTKERITTINKQLSDKNSNMEMSQKDLVPTSSIMLNVTSSSSTILNGGSNKQTNKVKNKNEKQLSMIKVAQMQIKQAGEILKQAKNQVNDNPVSALNKVLTVKKILATVNQITGAVLPMNNNNNNNNQQSIANQNSDKINSDKIKNVTSTNKANIGENISNTSQDIKNSKNNDNLIIATSTTTSTKSVNLEENNLTISTVTTSTIGKKQNNMIKSNNKIMENSDMELNTSSSTNQANKNVFPVLSIPLKEEGN